MQKIGLIFAMDKELELFIGSLTGLTHKSGKITTFYYATFNNLEVIAVVGGIGKVNAALTTADLINQFAPDCIINLGISGGLSPKLNIGDFVIGTDIVYHDVWCGEPNEYGQIQGLPAIFHSSSQLANKLDFAKGLICCGDKFITDKAELDAIVQKFPTAMAVDMESAAIAQTCYIYNTPLLSIRQISDTPGEHQAEQYQQFWQNAPHNSINTLTQILEKL